jgi:hypothetical protein
MVVDSHREVSIGVRRNLNPDVVPMILCPDVVRMMSLMPPVLTEQGTIEARQGKILL